jgi:phytoene synthase
VSGAALVPTDASALRTFRQTLAEGSRTFRFAGRFLPDAALDDAAGLYAFCRLVDDLADDAPDRETALRNLDAVRAELEGRAQARVEVRAVLEVAARTGMDPALPHLLLEGVESDQVAPRVMADEAALLRYCYHVASTVGLMMCGILGVRTPAAMPHAIDLGVAMQLTNIARDVREDAAMGRVYLPESWLAEAGLSSRDLLDGRPDRAGLRRVTHRLLMLAERYYQSGFDGMRWIPARTRLGIVVAALSYRAIGRRLLRRAADPWPGRTVVSAPARVVLALGGVLWWASSPRLGGWGPPAQHLPALHRGLEGLPGAAPPPALPAADAGRADAA